jgi:hypothetical protein
MALPADLTIDIDAPPLRGVDVLAQLNNAIEEIRVLRTALAALATSYNATLTKLDADGGVTDVNYNSTKAVVTTTYATDTTHVARKIHKH